MKQYRELCLQLVGADSRNISGGFPNVSRELVEYLSQKMERFGGRRDDDSSQDDDSDKPITGIPLLIV